MTKQIKNRATARVADQLIGAAQALELEARRLKDAAKHIRAEGLLVFDTGKAAIDPCENQRYHKSHDIKAAARHALMALGTMKETDFLTERSWA